MSISKNIKKILVTGAALMMALSAGAGLANTQASSRRRYHYHYTRRIRRNRRRGYKRSRRYTKKRIRRRSKKTNRHIRRKRTVRHRSSNGFWPSRHELAKYAKHNGSTTNQFISDIKNNFGLFGKPTSLMKPYISSNNVVGLFSKNQLAAYKREDSDPLQAFTGANFNRAHRRYSRKARTNNTNRAVCSDTFRYLNQDRASRDEGPLTEDPTLNQVAKKRAWQLDHVGFTHDDPNGNGYASSMDPDVSAENIAEVYGPMYGKDAAESMNQNLFYNEAAYDGGHYENILHGGNNVGIGAYNDNGTYYLAEDFGN